MIFENGDHRSKLKLTAFLDACTSVLSYLPLKKRSYSGFLTIFVSLVWPVSPKFYKSSGGGGVMRVISFPAQIGMIASPPLSVLEQ